MVGDGTGTATIVDSDALFGPNPVINVSNPTFYEGDDGQRRAQFQIHLSRVPATNVTIAYRSEDGTAIAGVDYVQKLPGTVVFAPGQISKTIDVLVNSDTEANGDRDFTRLDYTLQASFEQSRIAISFSRRRCLRIFPLNPR